MKRKILKTSILFGAYTLLMLTFTGVAYGQAYTGTTTVNTQNNMSIDVTTYPVGDSVTITMRGPDNVWFAYGFGATAMAGTYCIVTDGNGNVSERKLGNHNQGSSLASSFTSSNTSVSAGVRTTVVKRSMTGSNADYYTFPGGGNGFSIIWAYGSGANFSSHANRGASMLIFSLDCSGVLDLTVSQSDSTFTANMTTADTYQWLDCDNGFAPIAGETNATFTASSPGNYAVEISSVGCTDTSACFTVNTVGLAENILANNVSLFPNPAQDEVTIDLGNVYEHIQITLTDLSGKQLKYDEVKGVSEIKFSIQEPAGVYLLNITIDGETSFSKPLMVK